MDQVNPINPEKWLLDALSDMLSDEKRERLLRDYAVVKRRYGVSQRLKCVRTELRRYEKVLALSPAEQSERRKYAVKIATRKAAIERYERELDNSAD